MLFESVRLSATPECLERLVDPGFGIISPFVKRVIFVPPPVSWILDLPEFKRIQRGQAEAKREARRSHGWRDSGQFDDFFQNIEDVSLEAEFEAYHAYSLSIKAVLTGDKLPIAWARALDQLLNLQSAHIVNFNHLDLFNHRQADQQLTRIYMPHNERFKGYQIKDCKAFSAPVGTAFFTAALTSLAKANKTPSDFQISLTSTGGEAWTTLPQWPNFNLSRVQTLELDAELLWEYTNDKDEEIGRCISEKVYAILEKCSQTLEELKLTHVVQWPDNRVILLPALKRFSVEWGEVRPGPLSSWILRMPSLDHIALQYTSQCGDTYGAWKFILDAIRDHPNWLQVDFEGLIANGHLEMSLQYNTADWETAMELKENYQEWHDIKRSLPLYLSGQIEYNTKLKVWFQEEEEDILHDLPSDEE